MIQCGFDFQKAYLCDLMENQLTELETHGRTKASGGEFRDHHYQINGRVGMKLPKTGLYFQQGGPLTPKAAAV